MEYKSLFNKIITSRKLLVILMIPLGLLVCWFFILMLRGKITISPHVTIGEVNFNYYGAIIGIAVLTVITFTEKSVTKNDVKLLENGWIYILLGALIGARIWHVFTDFYLYQNNIINAFKVWEGGLSIFGGLIGGVITLYIYLFINKRKRDFIYFLEKLIQFVPLGQSIGRLGNFVNQELYGYPTNLPWGMYIKPENRLSGFENINYYHPTFLYEIIGNLILFFILTKISQRFPQVRGLIIGFYLLGYGIVRSIVNLYRINTNIVSGVSMFASIIMITIGSIITFKTIYDYSRSNFRR